MTVRIQLPYQLRVLAGCAEEVTVAAAEPLTLLTAVRGLEARYPMLRGAVIDHYTGQRRPKVRFIACGRDHSLEPLDTELPAAVRDGREPLVIIGAISGG